MTTNTNTSRQTLEAQAAERDRLFEVAFKISPADHQLQCEDLESLNEAQLDEYYRVDPNIVFGVDMSSPVKTLSNFKREHLIPSANHNELIKRAKGV